MAKGKNLLYTIQITDKGTFRIKELNKEVKDLGKAFVSINGDIQEHTTIIQGTMSAYEQEIRTLKTLRDQTAKTAAAYSQYNTQIVRVEKKIKKLTSAQMSQEQVNAQMIANTGLASNTIVEFGRTISDAPFGIIGVTNNLGVLANNFELLSGKVGGTQNMFKLLIRQLKKGGAVVLAIQALLALMTYFRDDINKLAGSIFGSAKKIKEGMVEIKDEALASRAALSEYLAILNDINSSMSDQETALQALLRSNSSLSKALDKQMVTGQKRNDLTSEMIQLQLDFSIKSNELNKKMDGFNEKDRNRIKVMITKIEKNKEIIANEKALLVELEKGLDVVEKKHGWEVQTQLTEETQAKNRLAQAERHIADAEKVIKRRGMDIDLIRETLALEEELTGFVDNRINKYADIPEFEIEIDMTDIDKFEASLIGKILNPDEELTLRQQLDAVPVLDDGSIDEVLTEWDEFMTGFRDKNSEKVIKRAEDEALAKLEILYNSIEEETGTRIGFEEDKTRIEEHFAKKRTRIAEIEQQAKVRSHRLAAQAVMQIGKLLQQVAGDNKGVAIAGVVMEKAGAIAKIIANKNIADAAALKLLSNPITAGTVPGLLTMNKVTSYTGIAATAASAAQAIKEIRNPESAATSTTGTTETTTPQIQAPNFNVVGSTQQSQLAQVISGQEDKPIKAFVVADDVTTTQELLRKVLTGASLG